MQQVRYAEESRNPFAKAVVLDERGLRIGRRAVGYAELNTLAMAEAFMRGRWLGPGGTERLLAEIGDGPGAVPVTRATGTTRPLRVRRAAAFAHALGEVSVWLGGGPGQVADAAARAYAEGVPLWIARRFAPGPAGPVAVAVDRRSVRVDVWGAQAPAVRARAPYGLTADHLRDPARGLLVTVGEAPARLVVTRSRRRSQGSVVLEAFGRRWELRRLRAHSSRLTRNGYPVADLARPPRARPDPHTGLLPLAAVRHDGPDPLDAVMAHFFAAVFGLGDGTGSVRFRYRTAADREPVSWDDSWFSGLGSGGDEGGSGGGSDGWDSVGSDGGSGGGGGGDGGGGGGDGGGGGGGGGD